MSVLETDLTKFTRAVRNAIEDIAYEYEMKQLDKKMLSERSEKEEE